MAKDYSKYTDEQLNAALNNPKASRKLKREIQMELNSRMSEQTGDQSRSLDPITGQPTGGAPEWMANLTPSLFSLGDDITTGIANMVTDPVGTAANVIPGTVEHYQDRYFTPEPGQPFYSDAVNTFNQDPAGFGMDMSLIGTGMKMAGAGGRIGQAGSAIERLDPVTALAGAAQTAMMPVQNRIPSMPSPQEAMAGTDYGQPRGAQRENLSGYLGTVGDAMEQNIPPTVSGAETAQAKRQAAGAEVGEIIDALEADGQSFRSIGVVNRLNDIKNRYNLNADAPLRNAVDEIIGDIVDNTSESGTISPSTLQNIKERWASRVNYDSATPATERTTQKGYEEGTKAIREDLRSVPALRESYDQYGRAVDVEDVVRRGAAADVTRSGRGFSGDFVAQILNSAAPILTGQNKLDRNRARMAYNRGEPFEAYRRATRKTPYGVLRQGAYTADMAGKTDEENRWHVGRLWED